MESMSYARDGVNAETRVFRLGIFAARWIVPLYFFLGAAFKLMDGSPLNLPAALIKFAGWANIDLLYLLRLSIGVELTVAGVIILLPRLGRPVGLFLLGIFLPILVGDLLLGASSCGCFGVVVIPPWVTLIMDGTLFGVLWYFGARDPRLRWTSHLPSSRVFLAGLVTVGAFMIGFYSGVEPAASTDPAPNPEARVEPLPAEGYYLPEYSSWIGKKWSEIPLSSWIQGTPVDWGHGEEYILLYRKDCEHCHALIATYFSGVLPAPVLAVAVPEKNGFPTENLQPFVCQECQQAELPSGIDWFFQTPVLIRLEDGVVDCAAEVSVEDPQCIEP